MSIISYEECPLVPPPRSELAAFLDAVRMEWLADHWSPHAPQSGGEAA